MTFRFRAAAVFAVLFTLIGGGGALFAHEGHDDDDFAAGEPGDAAKPSRLIAVTMSEKDGKMLYEPSEVDVKKGEQVKFVITNAGTLSHEFHLDTVEDNAHHKREMEKNPEMVHDDPNAQTIEPGKQAVILWKFSKAGVFEFACLIPGHYDAGMHGRVVVK
ncbi:Blue (Type 1) copper domain protein [Hyphomicrobium sp. GJ21]|mgnify:CR=1 FL=1|uniref:cupredoxin domain-containing protein n=1 Tax=Hyphomicrobium sp. GJ21 TaxID=113574 RepID=UPI000622BFD1|nr:cupredoxin family protein [Hyphomicrobium sp. GJ21]CEJ88113.1 Blue (Type 1) copper domain protein [Hyphomicrobium sp. GJ21]